MEPTIVQAQFYLSSAYQDQHVRNFETRRNTDDLTDLFLRETQDGRNLSAASLGRVAADIMGLRSAVSGRDDIIEIENGWAAERLSFIIVVEMESYRGSSKRIGLTGYTDFDGVSRLTGDVDPKMLLIINNCFTVRSTEVHTRRGTGRRESLVNNEYIIRGRQPKGRSLLLNSADQHDTMLRPSDIYFNKAGADHINALGGSDTYVDQRSKLVGDIHLAKRIHNNASNYLSDVISTGVEAEVRVDNARGKRDLENDRMGRRDYGDEEDELSVAENAAARLAPDELSRNELFTLFMQRTEFEQSGEITWGDLLDCCVEGRDTQIQYIGAGSPDRRGARDKSYTRYSEGDSQHFRGADPATMAAEITAKTLPALMMLNLTAAANITLTNETKSGQIEALVTGEYPMIKGMDISYNVQDLEKSLVWDLGRLISRNNEIVFHMEVDVNILADMVIKLSIEREPSETWIVPIFSDGLLSPMKANQHNALENITRDLDDIITATLDCRMHASEKAHSRRRGGDDALDSIFKR